MSEKVYTATKPTTVNGGANPSIKQPPTKAQVYKRKPPPRKRHCSIYCCCYLFINITIAFIIIAAIFDAILWRIYNPHGPNFTVLSIQITQFNLTSTNFNSEYNFTFKSRNPNKKIKFFYKPISISVFSNGINIADGSLPGFMLDTKNTTILNSVLSGQIVAARDISTLQSKLKKKKNSLSLNIQMNTKVQAKIGRLKTRKLKAVINCDGAKLNVPGGQMAPSVATSKIKCDIDHPPIRIFPWRIGS